MSYRVGITSARKVDELRGLLERRGASVEHAAVLNLDSGDVDDVTLAAATATVLAGGIDVFVATTGVGIRGWFAAAERSGQLEPLLEALRGSVILARGPKSVGALRAYGLQELWSPESESLADVVAQLRLQDLNGKRVVLQEHGLSLAMTAGALRMLGADVEVVSVYAVAPASDLAPIFGMVGKVVKRELDAVTFTSAPAVAAFMEVADAAGVKDRVIEAFSNDVLATCVGPVTAAAFEPFSVPTVQPDRPRLGPMVRTLEQELIRRHEGTTVMVRGRRLTIRGTRVYVDGVPAKVTGAPLAILLALAERPGVVLSRKQLLSQLPSGNAASEHAVEMAVARLRVAVGPSLVQTVVKRGYRIPV